MPVPLRELPLAHRKVLVRVDFNVPLNPDGNIRDDTRIREALPTLQAIQNAGGIPVVLSHLGRPRGQKKAEYSLAPVARHVATLLDCTVHFAPDCIGELAQRSIAEARPGELVVLENLRFHPGEEANDPHFAAQLANGLEVYVNDAFGAAHRAHASVVAITRYVRRKGMGLLMERELSALQRLLHAPESPYVAIVGGAKVSDKLEVLQALLHRCDVLLLGGGLAFTFLKAYGVDVGDSLVEEELLPAAQQLLEQVHREGKQLVLPVDARIATAFAPEVEPITVELSAGIPKGWKGGDIGPQSVALFVEHLQQARTLFWNGPLGVYELAPFQEGTHAIARAVAEATRRGAFSVVGGGDSIAAFRQVGLSEAVSHLCTGGGAALEFLAGRKLPGLEALESDAQF